MPIRFTATELSREELTLQGEVRAFLDGELPAGYRPGLGMNAPADRDFSRRLGERGWLGMALPKKYGGAERGAVDRFVVTEELLRRGAPLAHHWTADRQSGAVINRFGTEEQKQRFLPPICRGEIAFCIGMSEPGTGSDLASLRSRATRDEGGWRLSGTKVWTTGAHRSEWMIGLFRTSDEADRHLGLTQFLVDLQAPGLTTRPILLLDGTADFAEVSLEDVFVADDLVLGDVGKGWTQNTAELAFERGGPDRFLSTYPVIEAFLRETPADALNPATRTLLGRAAATYWVMRNLTLAIARSVDEGASPTQEAALVKEMATRFEQDVIAALVDTLDIEPAPDSSSIFQRVLGEAILTAPAFTIRGGTNEILRSVAAKGLRA